MLASAEDEQMEECDAIASPNKRISMRNRWLWRQIELVVSAPCGLTGRMKCFSNFSKEKRLDIFKGYWSLGDTNA